MITIAFGFCFRSTDPEDLVLFSTWAYSPPYLPKKIVITVATNSGMLSEPMLFQIPFAQRPDRYPPQKLQLLNYRLGMIPWQCKYQFQKIMLLIIPPTPLIKGGLRI